MAGNSATGVPFTDAMSDSVDESSREVFEALREWPVAREGHWTRWEPGYLVLEIAYADGDAIEPVVIDTYEGEVTVTFGYWETHLPEPFGTANAGEAVEQAKDLVKDWLSGRLRTAVFTDDEGKWCGSKLVEEGDLLPQLSTDWIASFGPTRVEVRTSRTTDWRRFVIRGDRILEVI